MIIEEHNGVKLSEIYEALDMDDAKRGRRLLRRMLAPEALPCPCCGSGEPEFLEHYDNVEIFCPECGIRTSVMEYADAVETWNRRAHVEKTDK